MPPKEIFTFGSQTSCPGAYCNVLISDDTLVERFMVQRYNINSSPIGYDFLSGSQTQRYYDGTLRAKAVKIPGEIYYIVDYVYYTCMGQTQQYYPILVSEGVGVQEVARPEALRIVPNPASGRVTIAADSPIWHYEVIAMTGRTVLKGSPRRGGCKLLRPFRRRAVFR